MKFKNLLKNRKFNILRGLLGSIGAFFIVIYIYYNRTPYDFKPLRNLAIVFVTISGFNTMYLQNDVKNTRLHIILGISSLILVGLFSHWSWSIPTEPGAGYEDFLLIRTIAPGFGFGLIPSIYLVFSNLKPKQKK